MAVPEYVQPKWIQPRSLRTQNAPAQNAGYRRGVVALLPSPWIRQDTETQTTKVQSGNLDIWSNFDQILRHYRWRYNLTDSSMNSYFQAYLSE